MTDSNEKILSTEAEDDLLNDDHDPKEKAPTTDHQDPMYTMMQNVNKTLGTLTGSLVAMNESIKDLKRLHSSNTDDQPDPKRRKHSSRDEMSASEDSEEDGGDSDAEI